MGRHPDQTSSLNFPLPGVPYATQSLFMISVLSQSIKKSKREPYAGHWTIARAIKRYLCTPYRAKPEDAMWRLFNFSLVWSNSFLRLKISTRAKRSLVRSRMEYPSGIGAPSALLNRKEEKKMSF